MELALVRLLNSYSWVSNDFKHMPVFFPLTLLATWIFKPVCELYSRTEVLTIWLSGDLNLGT